MGWIGWRGLVVGLALAASAGAAAQAENPPVRDSLAAARSFALLVDLKDQVFGTRPEGMMQKATPLFATDWGGGEDVAGRIARMLAADGRRVDPVKAGEVAVPQGEKRAGDDEELAALSAAISKAHPEMDVDVHLLVLGIPLDRYGREYRPGAYFMNWGVVGLLSHESEAFRRAYVVRVNDSMSAHDWGKVECTMGYTLVALDAKSHRIIAKTQNQLTHGRLPDTFWIGDYSSLSAEDKGVLRRACLDAASSSVAASIRALGVAEPAPYRP